MSWLLTITAAWASAGLGLASATSPSAPSGWSAGAAVTSDTFTGLSARALHPLGERGVVWGVGADLPVMLWARGGGLDTGRLVLQASAEPLRGKRFGLGVHAQSRVGVQRDNLGVRVPWETSAAVTPGIHLGQGFLAVAAGWRQGLATYIAHSDRVTARFEDVYPDGAAAEGPEDGWLALPTSRGSLGLLWTQDLGERWQLSASGGAIHTRTDWGAPGFDAMMIGVWPFWAEVGATHRW